MNPHDEWYLFKVAAVDHDPRRDPARVWRVDLELVQRHGALVEVPGFGEIRGFGATHDGAHEFARDAAQRWVDQRRPRDVILITPTRTQPITDSEDAR